VNHYSQVHYSEFPLYYIFAASFVNNGKEFELKPLPTEAQFSIVNSILYKDYNNDGIEDIFLAGNFYPFRVQQGRCDAGLGYLLKGDGKGNFIPLDRKKIGVYIGGDVRDMVELRGVKNNIIVISKNNDLVQVVKRL